MNRRPPLPKHSISYKYRDGIDIDTHAHQWVVAAPIGDTSAAAERFIGFASGKNELFPKSTLKNLKPGNFCIHPPAVGLQYFEKDRPAPEKCQMGQGLLLVQETPLPQNQMHLDLAKDRDLGAETSMIDSRC